jgi:hypothetical protein
VIKRILLVILSVVFIASLIGTTVNIFVPGNERDVTISEYESKGWIDIASYSRPKLSFGQPVVFPNIVESFEASFVYFLKEDGGKFVDRAVSVDVILSEQSGKWSKRMPVSASVQDDGGKEKLTFDLDIKGLFNKANLIESEIDPKFDPKSSGPWMVYGLAIEIKANGGGYPEFTSSVKGKLGYRSLEWETLFEEYRRGSGYWEVAGLSYDAKLKSNSLFSSQKLDLALDVPDKVSPTDPLVIGSMEATDAVINYMFVSDIAADTVKIVGVAEVEISSPDKWRTKVLSMPIASDKGELKSIVPIDIDSIRSAIRSADDRVDFKSSVGVDIILRVNVKTEATLVGKSISEEMEFNELRGRIDSDRIIWETSPPSAKQGKIIEKEDIFFGAIPFMKQWAFIPFIISLGILLYLLAKKVRSLPEPTINMIERKKRRKYRGLFVEVRARDIPNFDVPEELNSLEDLVTMAEIRGTEVRFCDDIIGNKVTYWISIEGRVIRYKAEND